METLTLKQIAGALFIPLATTFIIWLAAKIYKKVDGVIEAAKARGVLLLDIEEANEEHYKEDKLLFQRLEAKVEEVMAANIKRFEKIEQRLDNRYSNEVLDAQFKLRDAEIANLEERVDDMESRIVAHIDRSTATILEQLKNRHK